MRTEIVKIFTLDELSADLQEKAHEHYLGKGDEYAWTDEIVDAMKAFEKLFPIKIKTYEFDAYTFNCNWHFTGLDGDIAGLSGQRLATYIWNNYRRDLFKGKYYSTAGEYIDGKCTYKSRRSRIILENSCVLTGVCYDDDILQPVYEFLNKPTGLDFEGLIGECFDNFGKAVKAELRSQLSFEYFKDMALANEWEFTETGEMI